MSDILNMNISTLSHAMSEKQLSSEEVTRAYLTQIKQTDSKYNTFLTLTEETALNSAKAIDTLRMKKQSLPTLAGIPVAIKDNICTKGIRTTCASKMLENFVPAYDATVAQKLNAQHTITLGKLNMDEFAMGSSNENSAFSIVKNPVDPARVPGGSSGASAAAVAANLAPFTLGSDTGGSIRQPASFCGVVGLKPTYGRVSRYGLIAFASSLDQIGPLTRNVEDCATVLSAICGHDPLDSTSATQAVPDFAKELHNGVKDMKIALPEELLGEGIAPAVKLAVENAAKLLENQGAKIEMVSMPSLKFALPAYYVISSAEASSNLARFDGVRYGMRASSFDSIESLYQNTRSQGFGDEVKRRIMLGTFTLSAGYYDAYYKKALQVKTLIVKEYQKIFDNYDLVLTPTAPNTAWRFGERSNPMEMYLGDICTVPTNIAGLPAISLPCGTDTNNLPIGVQLTGNAFEESTILRAAQSLENAVKEVSHE
jgi:aspartyl/glutamyl-tRNA(Asn/Gln) amidotransferase, A subunit